MRTYKRIRASWLAVLALGALTACGPREAERTPPASTSPLRKVKLQTDWFPQAEHGGFYHAWVKGYYRDVGLDVELLPGGLNAGIKLKVAKGDVEFGMNRSDDLAVSVDRGLPLVIVGVLLQRDPQALLLHEANPVQSFADLDGKTITAALGQTWIVFLQHKYGITFNLRPLHFGLGTFMADPSAIQQCFLTNEPFYVRQQGGRPKVLPIADSGYDAYHTIFTRRAFWREHPEVVRAFVAASLRGWRDYLVDDPTETHAEILRRNAQMSPEFLAFSRGELIARQLVTGQEEEGDALGRLRVDRLTQQIATLRQFGVVEKPLAPEDIAIPEALFPPAGAAATGAGGLP